MRAEDGCRAMLDVIQALVTHQDLDTLDMGERLSNTVAWDLRYRREELIS